MSIHVSVIYPPSVPLLELVSHEFMFVAVNAFFYIPSYLFVKEPVFCYRLVLKQKLKSLKMLLQRCTIGWNMGQMMRS